MSFYPGPQPEGVFMNAQPGHPYELGPEVMNHMGIRIFQQHLGPASTLPPRPVALGMDLHLVPIGVAYAPFHTGAVPSTYPHEQYAREYIQPGTHAMPPAPAQAFANAYMPYPPPPEHREHADFPEAASPGPGSRSPTCSTGSSCSSCDTSSQGSCSQECCRSPSEPQTWTRPTTWGRVAEAGRGAGSSSRKRKYDEYLRGGAGGSSSSDGIPDGWYKCDCCTSGWYYVDPSEEDDGRDDRRWSPHIKQEDLGSEEQEELTDYYSEGSEEILQSIEHD